MTSKVKILIGSIVLMMLITTVLIILIFSSLSSTLSGPMDKGFINFDDSTKTEEEQEQLLVEFLDSIDTENDKISHKLTGDKVSILITGIDSRLGSTRKHADANHLINVWFKPGIIEIISMPRGTYAYAGFVDPPRDTTGADSSKKFYTQNYLANVRAYLGRKRYTNQIKRISKVKQIDYYVEFGFSQAIGLLELIGYKEKAVQVLRLLRTRQVYGGQEHQRNYNQGQFIRQMLLKLFPKLDGIEGDILIRTALFMVETDLDVGTVKEIIKKLKKKGFPRSPDDVILRLRPKYGHKYFSYDFSQEETIDTLYKKLATKALRLGVKDKEINSNDIISNKIASKLNAMIDEAQYYLVEDPNKLIRTLRITFDQRAWFQISDPKERARVRKRICYLLSKAYEEVHDFDRAKEVENILEMEERVFSEFEFKK